MQRYCKLCYEENAAQTLLNRKKKKIQMQFISKNFPPFTDFLWFLKIIFIKDFFKSLSHAVDL